MATLSRRDNLIYLAGIIDGEGCITISYVPSKRGGYRLALRVSMYNTAALKLFVVTFGGYVQALSKASGKPEKLVRAEGQKAGSIIRELLPFLRVKQRQAQIALRYCQVHTGKKGFHQSDAELEEKKKLWYEMQEAVHESGGRRPRILPSNQEQLNKEVDFWKQFT